MSGAFSPLLERINAQIQSDWCPEAIFLNNSHRAPISPLLNRPSFLLSVTGFAVELGSRPRDDPADFRPPRVIRAWFNTGAGEVVRIPDTGELQKNRRGNTPADRITSLVAVYVVVWLLTLTTTPVARLPSSTILCARAEYCVRLGRFRTGLR